MDIFILLFGGVIFIWLSVVTFYLYKTINHYNKLTNGLKKEKLEDILNLIIAEFGENKKKLTEIKKQIIEITEDGTKHIQKLGLLRFNPFENTGGEQSFILAIMDKTDSGIVISSLHNRGMTRWYAKNVKNGKGIDYELSEEEKKAIKQAITFERKN